MQAVPESPKYRPEGYDCQSDYDPCSCPDGSGWSKDLMTCVEGSTTSCDECPTMEGCVADSCAVSLCPDSYDPMRLCQCTANCEEYENCCEDADVCDGGSESEEEEDGCVDNDAAVQAVFGPTQSCAQFASFGICG